MGKLFNLDNPVMNFLSKMADLLWLNIITFICCIPIITIGASMTALHYVLLKMVRDEEGYITRSFFKSFKQNFKQATVIWLIMLLFIVVWGVDLYIFRYADMQLPTWLEVALWAIGAVAVFATVHIFPVLSKFDNSIKNTFKNSLFMGILSLPKTITMMVCWAIPIAVTVFLPQIFPIVIAFGISGPAFLCALLYNKTFKKFEPEENITSDNEWTVTVEADDNTGNAED